jgi:hypothetical protein
MNQTTKSSVVLLAFAGLGSALLSVTVKSVHNFELFFVGFVFGIALAGYFVVLLPCFRWQVCVDMSSSGIPGSSLAACAQYLHQ